MLKVQGQVLGAPGIGSRILQFMNDSSLSPILVVENLDSSLSAAISYEESDDGSTWSTIVGTSKSISPGQSDAQIILSNRRKIALFAQGNVNLQINVIRQYNGDSSILD